MSIYNSYSNPTTSLQRKPVKPSPLGKGSPSARSGGSIKFGLNGFWPTTEFMKKSGGLGEVSRSIPAAFSKYSAQAGEQHDLRVICPYEDIPNVTKDFKQTNTTIKLTTATGEIHKFEVFQKFEPAPNAQQGEGNWVYALKSPLFQEDAEETGGPKKNTGLSEFTYTGENQESARKVLLFNQAAAELVNFINTQKKNPNILQSTNGEALQTFTAGDRRVNFVIGNDWLTGPVLSQPRMQEEQNKNIRKVFMLHNTYDNVQWAGFLDHHGLPIPKKLKNVGDGFSPLQMGLQSADVVIGNKNYVRTITETPFSKGQRFVETLKSHSAAGRVHDIHHGLAEDYDPTESPALTKNQDSPDEPQNIPNKRDYQFVQLQGDDLNSVEAWTQFKAANKTALQAKLGLNHNPDATILGWAARLDPFQKGFYTVKNTMENLLEKNPNLQIIVAGSSPEPSIIQWISEMSQKYPGRLYMPNAFVDKTFITQINAGSDFVMLPSLYEPYGLTQLEAMKMGAIPIVHGVDGIRSSVSDPTVNGKDFIGPDEVENAWKNPDNEHEQWQTGILMRPMKRNIDGEPEAENIDGNNGHIPFAQVKKAIDVHRYQKALNYERGMLDVEALMPELTGGKSKDQRQAESIQGVIEKNRNGSTSVEELEKLANTLKEAHQLQSKRADSFKTMAGYIGKIRNNAHLFTHDQIVSLTNLQEELEQKQAQQDIRTEKIKSLDLNTLAKDIKRKAKDGTTKLSPRQVTKLEQIKKSLEEAAPSIPVAAKNEVFDPIIRRIVVAPAMMPAEDSFIEAVTRAVDMSAEARQTVRSNAVRYVNAAHAWPEIVKRYHAILIGDSAYKAPAVEYYEKSPFEPPQKPSQKKSKNSAGSLPRRQAPPPKSPMEQAWDWILFILQPWKWFG